MANNKYQWNNRTGTGWMKGKDGRWYQYKDHKKTGVSKNNLTLGSGVAKFISKNVKKAQSTIAARSEANRKAMIGKGTAQNPEFITNKKGSKVKNPRFKPPTMVAKNNTTNKKDNNTNNNNKKTDKKTDNKNNPWSVRNLEKRGTIGEVGTSNADAKGSITWHKDPSQRKQQKKVEPDKDPLVPSRETPGQKADKLQKRVDNERLKNTPLMKRGQHRRTLERRIKKLREKEKERKGNSVYTA